MPDVIIFTGKEQEKLSVINATIAGKMTNDQAARILSVSPRQIKRLKKSVRLHGSGSIVHKLKGQTGNRRIHEDEKQKTLQIIKEGYRDFNPGFATEKLEENHKVILSPETIRKWMIEAKLWKPHRQKKTGKYRSWRPRKEYFGELEQFDGSYHHWLENRFLDQYGESLEVCLLACIDDATGEITKAVFAANEGVVAVFEFWKGYVENLGKPLIIYLDKFSTYKINHKSAVDNKELMTQFQRAMQDLGIQLISAHSPQAKGRIEKLFGTLQNRLVKEMRLAQINTPEAGNKFLKDVFLPKFNERFSVVAAKEGNVHRGLSKDEKRSLSCTFSIQSIRKINNDFTIQFKNNWYQLAEIQPTTVRAKEKVTVEIWLDASIHFSLRKYHLNYTLLPKKPEKVKRNPVILTRHKLNWIPPENHPWRKTYKAKP